MQTATHIEVVSLYYHCYACSSHTERTFRFWTYRTDVHVRYMSS